MGIVRKLTSVSTLGLVKYRNPQEQSARFAKQTRNAARANVVQNMTMIELQRKQLEAQEQTYVMGATQVAATLQGRQQQQSPRVPASWRPDPTDVRALTWWDGTSWHPDTKHYPAAADPSPPRVLPQLPATTQWPTVAAGWLKDPADSRAMCWWDGQRWHPESRRYPDAPAE